MKWLTPRYHNHHHHHHHFYTIHHPLINNSSGMRKPHSEPSPSITQEHITTTPSLNTNSHEYIVNTIAPHAACCTVRYLMPQSLPLAAVCRHLDTC
ncbi:hypothetical protein E2C01_010381 [Portunus trituberculatus]|uniref:Uncharacterized protein n=1 Tax=Portunus trituberculatus TaxID=210409 RepID=A0A5B7D8J0_PORTR|nr:hypothetical protein [Portunus trituberculatus]